MEKGAEALNNDMGNQGIGAIEYLGKLISHLKFAKSGKFHG